MHVAMYVSTYARMYVCISVRDEKERERERGGKGNEGKGIEGERKICVCVCVFVDGSHRLLSSLLCSTQHCKSSHHVFSPLSRA